jgi:hypothetical protein
MGAAQDKERAVAEVLAFMKKRGLALADLIEVGGEDLSSTNPKKVEKAKRVEKCWGLMAKLGINHPDLEAATGTVADKPATRVLTAEVAPAEKRESDEPVCDFASAGNSVDVEESAEQRKQIHAALDDLAQAVGPTPEKSSRVQRGEGMFLEAVEKIEVLAIEAEAGGERK